MAKKRFDDNTDIAASFLLPGVEVYPNNRFGDIARKQGLETARNWREVRKGTVKGMNDFAGNATSAMTTGVSFVPVVGDAVDAADMYNAYKKGDNVGIALAGFGFIPFVGGAAKRIAKTAKEGFENAGYKTLKKLVSVSEKVDDKIDEFDRFIAPDIKREGFKYSGNDDDYINFLMRMEFGGLEKLGLNKDVKINIDKNNSLFKSPKSKNINIEEREGDLNRYRLGIQDFILNKRPIDGKYAFFNRKDIEAVVPDGDSNYYTKAAHEHGHIVDYLRHLYNDSFDDTVNGKIPGFSMKRVHPSVRGYFLKNDEDATEILQRVGQVKNYLGINNPKYNLTPEDWAYARKNYVKDTGIDNQMQKMFRGVKDPKAFLDWANPLVPAIGGAAFILPYSNNNNENKRRFDYEQ